MRKSIPSCKHASRLVLGKQRILYEQAASTSTPSPTPAQFTVQRRQSMRAGRAHLLCTLFWVWGYLPGGGHGCRSPPNSTLHLASSLKLSMSKPLGHVGFYYETYTLQSQCGTQTHSPTETLMNGDRLCTLHLHSGSWTHLAAPTPGQASTLFSSHLSHMFSCS